MERDRLGSLVLAGWCQVLGRSWALLIWDLTFFFSSLCPTAQAMLYRDYQSQPRSQSPQKPHLVITQRVPRKCYSRMSFMAIHVHSLPADGR